jgi:hypothetical protein
VTWAAPWEAEAHPIGEVCDMGVCVPRMALALKRKGSPVSVYRLVPRPAGGRAGGDIPDVFPGHGH